MNFLRFGVCLLGLAVSELAVPTGAAAQLYYYQPVTTYPTSPVTYYVAPIDYRVNYPAANSCAPLVSTVQQPAYAPQATNRTVWRLTPVTVYRPIAVTDPWTGQLLLQQHPVTEMRWEQNIETSSTYQLQATRGAIATTELSPDVERAITYAERRLRKDLEWTRDKLNEARVKLDLPKIDFGSPSLLGD